MNIDRQKLFLYGITAFIGLICFTMISSFIGYLLSGLLLAFITHPLFQKLNQKLGPHISATAVLIITIFTAILPFIILLGVIGGDAAQLMSGINTTEGIEAVQQAENLITQYTGQTIDIQQRAQDLIGRVASFLPSGFSSAINLATDLSIGISLMLFLQFYALKDGKKFVEWTKKFDFMTDQKQNILYDSTARSVWAVVKGHVFVAFAQGILAGIGLYIFGIPNTFFWTAMMILLGFIPIIGSALVWFPAAIYLGLSGDIVNAALLTAYGIIVVGGSDNIIRPLTVDEDAGIHPFFVLVGIIGGVGLFGPVGLFLGPVTFGVLKNLLNMIIEKQ